MDILLIVAFLIWSALCFWLGHLSGFVRGGDAVASHYLNLIEKLDEDKIAP